MPSRCPTGQSGSNPFNFFSHHDPKRIEKNTNVKQKLCTSLSDRVLPHIWILRAAGVPGREEQIWPFLRLEKRVGFDSTVVVLLIALFASVSLPSFAHATRLARDEVPTKATQRLLAVLDNGIVQSFTVEPFNP